MQPESANSAWELVFSHLQDQSGRIRQEITSYPHPIPACDQQFNHLLEQRERVSQELSRMLDVRRENAASGELAQVLEEFVTASHFIDEVAAQRFRSTLLKDVENQEQ